VPRAAAELTVGISRHAPSAAPRLALVTGSTRGIGREVARRLAERGDDVVVTGRRADDAARAAEEIGARYSHPFDAADARSIESLATWIEELSPRLHVLVNNAAILLDEGRSITDVEPRDFEATWRANTLGPFALTRRLVPRLRASGHARVVNVSSGAGQISSMEGYAPSYSVSKAALNAVTVLFAHALRRDGVLVNCVDPGWVRTDMGGASAPRSVEEGADTIVWLATLPDRGPSGGFFHDRRRIAW
jgi:NAD(P)-dependent dehydrogenase (short-subunit alcohol dehydrogenase family)